MLERFRNFIILPVIIVFLLAPFSSAVAQNTLQLTIDQVDFTRFPEVDLRVTVRDEFGIPVQDLYNEHFSLQESGLPVRNFTVMPIDEQPFDIALVLDTSSTTGYGSKNSALQSAARAARNLVNSLGEQDRTAVISFGDKATTLQPLTVDRHPVNASLSLLEPQGNSALNDAILSALNLLKNSKRPVILLFTDGPDSGRGLISTAQAAQAAFQQGVPVYIIGWRLALTRDLQNLAALTGGSFQFIEGNAPPAEDFLAAINMLQPALKALRGQYHISYVSQLTADDKDHKIQLQVITQGHRQQVDTTISALSQHLVISLPGIEDGQVVGGILKLKPKVEPPAPLARLDLMMDGNPIPDQSSPTGEIEFDTTLLAPGTHLLSAQAVDTAGNAGELELTLQVRPPITVTILSPESGAIVRGLTTISARLESIADLDRVEFWIDEQIIATPKSPPFETTWDPGGLPAGPHQVRLVAFDIQGHSAEALNTITIPSISFLPALLIGMVVLVVVAVVIIMPLQIRSKLQKRDEQISEILHRPQAFLREMEGLNPGMIWVLEKDELRLGRKLDENDLPLKGLSAARQHAVIRYQDRNYIIISLYPEKPALVNEIPIQPQAVLKSGDTLRLGETVLHFEMQG